MKYLNGNWSIEVCVCRMFEKLFVLVTVNMKFVTLKNERDFYHRLEDLKLWKEHFSVITITLAYRNTIKRLWVTMKTFV